MASAALIGPDLAFHLLFRRDSTGKTSTLRNKAASVGHWLRGRARASRRMCNKELSPQSGQKNQETIERTMHVVMRSGAHTEPLLQCLEQTLRENRGGFVHRGRHTAKPARAMPLAQRRLYLLQDHAHILRQTDAPLIPDQMGIAMISPSV